MSTTPTKYQPSARLIDDAERLRQLYRSDGLSVREIATYHAEVGQTAVYEALDEYGILDNDDKQQSNKQCTRGHDPDWNRVA